MVFKYEKRIIKKMKKAIGRMNKSELLEFVKELKDADKAKTIIINMSNEEIERLELRISEITDNYRILKAESEIDRKSLRRYAAQKQLLKEESEIQKEKVGFWRNLFS